LLTSRDKETANQEKNAEDGGEKHGEGRG
jgi:hypothetical protein